MSNVREQAIMNRYTGSTSSGSTVDTSGSGGSTSGNGNNQDKQNNQTGETGSSGHSLLDQLNKLKAEGKGDTEQAKYLERYLSGVEQKYQSEGTSLYPDPPPLTTEDQYEQAAYGLSEWEKIQKLASLEAGDPFDPENKYAKSFAGQEFLKGWKGFDEEELKKEWINKFGLPSIISTPTSRSDLYGPEYPTKTTLRTDEYGQEIGGEYIYSGLGKELMGQLEGATSRGLPEGFDYGTAKETYWDDRAAQESIDQSQRTSWGGYDGGGGGGGGGTGYYGDPRTGNPVEQMANFFTPQANLQQAMVNVHSTPTVFAKRGGIVSLLRL